MRLAWPNKMTRTLTLCTAGFAGLDIHCEGVFRAQKLMIVAYQHDLDLMRPGAHSVEAQLRCSRSNNRTIIDLMMVG